MSYNTGKIAQELDITKRRLDAAGDNVQELINQTLNIRNGETKTLCGEIVVNENIIVESGGKLVIENAKILFERENGIRCKGVLVARSSMFDVSSADKRRTITLSGSGIEGTLIENCEIRGRGISLSIDRFGPKGDIKIKIKNTKFYSCEATNGGGIYIGDAGRNIRIENCKFERCVAENHGGGIYIDDSSPTIINCWFERCTAKYGGGIYLIYTLDTSPAIGGCKYKNCKASIEGEGYYRDYQYDSYYE